MAACSAANALDPNSWISEVEPFKLLSTSQFRTPGPRNLDSAAYAHEYNEVKSLGKVASPRNPEQEAIARFYNVSPLELFNRTYRTISQTEGLSLVEERARSGCQHRCGGNHHPLLEREAVPRFLAAETAIREGDNDGNKRTAGDPDWTPLEPTLPTPTTRPATTAWPARS